MEEKFLKNLISLDMKIKNICEGFEEANNKPVLLSNRLKILVILSEMDKISPTILVPMLSIAKSNLNLLCKKMLDEELIEKYVDTYDRRIIYYSLTIKGEIELNKKLEIIADNIEKYFNSNMDLEIPTLVNKLNGKIN